MISLNPMHSQNASCLSILPRAYCIIPGPGPYFTRLEMPPKLSISWARRYARNTRGVCRTRLQPPLPKILLQEARRRAREPAWVLFSFCFFKYLFTWLQRVLVTALRTFSCSLRTLSWGMWNLIPCPGIEAQPPALGAWSLSQWTAREVPGWFCFFFFNTQEHPGYLLLSTAGFGNYILLKDSLPLVPFYHTFSCCTHTSLKHRLSTWI